MLLEGMQRGEDEYDLAMDRYLARKPRKLDWIDGRKPTRDELHDRSGRTPHPTSPLPGGRREKRYPTP